MGTRANWRAELKSGAIGRNVPALGFTSFFTDISSEMVASALPAYAVLHLGLSPLEFGTIDGIQRGAALLVGVLIAFFVDRSGRHKQNALIGYGISAVCKLGLFMAAGVGTALSAILLVDRAGKGLRAPSRDALIAASTEPRVLATAFGIHRTLDAAGALLGPLVAFGVLAVAPHAFDAVFVVSLCVACVGLACLYFFVEDTPAPGRAKIGVRQALSLFLESDFRALFLVGLFFSLATVSDAFLYLSLQKTGGFDGADIPLLFAGAAVAQLVFTMPLARVADRIGRRHVFVVGQVCLIAAYATLLAPLSPSAKPVLLVVCLGLFLAATDGVLMAMTSARLSADRRASGLALVTGATGLGRLIASIAFGALWTTRGPEGALWMFGAAMLITVPLLALVLRAAETSKPSAHVPS